MSRIEQLISEIEMYLDGCKPQPFTNNKKIVVEKDALEEMLVELRMQTPDEIKKYQKIIANKDAILADANMKGDAIISDATKQAELIVSEHSITTQAQATAAEIVAQAEAQAKTILDSANYEAAQIREGAIAYTDSQLAMMQNILSNTISSTEQRYNGFVSQLNETLNVVTTNRNQLNGTTEPTSSLDDIDISL